MRTFIVRVMQHATGRGRAGAGRPQLCGVVDDVGTGLRATFRNDSELIAALVAAVQAPSPAPAGQPAEGPPDLA
jgi:hypothetical protein